jgi:hypothetical protein
MLEFIVGLIVGALVGWHVPQPEWVKNLLNKLKG